MPDTPAPRIRSAVRDEVRTWDLSLDQMLPPDRPTSSSEPLHGRLNGR